MNLQDCITFANENRVCHLATTDGDQARVRTLLMWFADDNGFYFATLSPKEIYQQLKNNPKVEICFYNNAADLQNAKSMRVTGQAEFLDDEALTKKVVEERAFLEQITGRSIGPITKVFRINKGEAFFWTMADVLKEPELERIKF